MGFPERHHDHHPRHCPQRAHPPNLAPEHQVQQAAHQTSSDQPNFHHHKDDAPPLTVRDRHPEPHLLAPHEEQCDAQGKSDENFPRPPQHHPEPSQGGHRQQEMQGESHLPCQR